tara:strand:- start:119 stop:826 length:708 start_codon:yes stop_codon:yes gene_type:complete
MKNSPYRILKLRSGEEIITRIVGKQRGKFILERPMIFKTSYMIDPLGRQKEVTILRNWLQYTDQIKMSIPEDHVASFIKPDESSEHLYDLEKEREDIDPTENTIKFQNDSDDKNESFFSDMTNSIMQALGFPSESESEKEEEDTDKDLPPELQDMNDFIMMNMIVPPSVFQNLIDNGLLDPESLKEEIQDILRRNDDASGQEEITDIYTGDEDVDKKDYGNKWTDWSNDIRDYLK